MQYNATAADIQCFKDWLGQVPYLPQDYDEHVIRLFIEGCKGRMEEAKGKFDGYHRVRMEYPDIMAGLDVNDPNFYYSMINYGHLALADALSNSGSLIMYIYPHLPAAETSLERVKHLFMGIHLFIAKVILVDLTSKFKGRWNGKFCLVTDMTHVTVSQMLIGVSPGLLKASFDGLYCLPLRVDSLHYINASAAFDKLIGVIKSVTKEKISERIHTHRTSDTLVDLIGPDATPSDYGGHLPTIKEISLQNIKWFKEKRDVFIKREEQLAELEKLRPKNSDDDVIVGTFRKLEVD